MDRVGKKILATGNGKCNYTNEVQGLSCYRGENPAFAVPVFRQFDQKKTVAFFREIGIEPKIKNGYYYPASEQAASVLDVLRMEAAYTGVKEIVSLSLIHILNTLLHIRDIPRTSMVPGMVFILENIRF